MKALVLAAGLGTRLRPLTYVRAKAAVPVNGPTLVGRVVRWLASQGIADLVINLHHRPASIARAVGDGSDIGVRVRYSWEDPVLGSAGGPRHALPLLTDGGAEPFLIVNGDTLTDVNVHDVAATHARSGALVTMALIPNPRPEKYGGVRVEDGFVTGFTRPGSPPPAGHFIGVQIADPAAFADLEDGVPAESVNGLYRRLMAADRRAIAAHPCTASFMDIGTPADYLATCLGLAATEGERLRGAGCSVAPGATLDRTVLWDDVVIGPGARLDSCVVCDGTTVPPGAAFEHCAILPAAGQAPREDDRIVGDLLTRRIG